MIEMEKPNIECVEMSDDGRYGKFVVSPLERGYGTTLGNSLRRILLSSLPVRLLLQLKLKVCSTNFQLYPVLQKMLQSLYLTLKSLL